MKQSPKPGNKAIDSFRQNHSDGFMRNRFFALLIDFIIVSLLCQFAFILFGAPDWGRYLNM